MTSHQEDTPLEEEQIIIPVLSEDEVKLESDNNHEREIMSHEEKNINNRMGFGDEVKLEGENEESEESQNRQMTTSQDDYELVSSASKQSSHASIDHDKTPTPPPEIVIPVEPTPSPPSSPVVANDNSSTTIVIENLEPITTTGGVDDQQKAIQPATPSIWQSILNALSSVMDWIRWVFGQ